MLEANTHGCVAAAAPRRPRLLPPARALALTPRCWTEGVLLGRRTRPFLLAPRRLLPAGTITLYE